MIEHVNRNEIKRLLSQKRHQTAEIKLLMRAAYEAAQSREDLMLHSEIGEFPPKDFKPERGYTEDEMATYNNFAQWMRFIQK